ncbi:hypothetical protein KVT40_006164 [Elsinoe batatas]|uniref:Uncharacterized protein n=1 Tax=Elsinoe batatas TaxID=2601811 RepID=A0A8K0L4S1_9PEZI|nr:hypothetical protein KVT40_006164 [Elsinoe batatas]
MSARHAYERAAAEVARLESKLRGLLAAHKDAEFDSNDQSRSSDTRKKAKGRMRQLDRRIEDVQGDLRDQRAKMREAQRRMQVEASMSAYVPAEIAGRIARYDSRR